MTPGTQRRAGRTCGVRRAPAPIPGQVERTCVTVYPRRAGLPPKHRPGVTQPPAPSGRPPVDGALRLGSAQRCLRCRPRRGILHHRDANRGLDLTRACSLRTPGRPAATSISTPINLMRACRSPSRMRSCSHLPTAPGGGPARTRPRSVLAPMTPARPARPDSLRSEASPSDPNPSRHANLARHYRIVTPSGRRVAVDLDHLRPSPRSAAGLRMRDALRPASRPTSGRLVLVVDYPACAVVSEVGAMLAGIAGG